ncbi:MAG: hypothetical protein AB7H97_17575 [Pseudobdellovibrionaceae bacterium]
MNIFSSKFLISVALIWGSQPVLAKKEAAPKEGGTQISGVILVDQDVVGKMPTKGTLFIFAKSQDAVGGPPLVVKKIDSPKFPVDFVLGPEDAMIPGSEFKGKIKVTARLTATPNALDKKGAIEGEVASHVGAKNLKVKLNKLLE